MQSFTSCFALVFAILCALILASGCGLTTQHRVELDEARQMADTQTERAKKAEALFSQQEKKTHQAEQRAASAEAMVRAERKRKQRDDREAAVKIACLQRALWATSGDQHTDVLNDETCPQWIFSVEGYEAGPQPVVVTKGAQKH